MNICHLEVVESPCYIEMVSRRSAISTNFYNKWYQSPGLEPEMISMGHMVESPGNKFSGSHGVNVTREIVGPEAR